MAKVVPPSKGLSEAKRSEKFGTNFAEAYWSIALLALDFVAQKARLQVNCYATKEVEHTASPVESFFLNVQKEAQEAQVEYELDEDGNPTEVVAAILRPAIPSFAELIDQNGAEFIAIRGRLYAFLKTFPEFQVTE
jgi:hypothetical protein